MNTFQSFQPVRVIAEGDNLGRAGTVRTPDSVETIDDVEVRTVGVLLDGDTELTTLRTADLRALA